MKDSERRTISEAADRLRSNLRLKASDLAGAWPPTLGTKQSSSAAGHRLRKCQLEVEIERDLASNESRCSVAWAASHLSAFAARAARRRGEPASKQVIECTFRGLSNALTAIKRRDGRLTFDALWPVIEALEELAAVVCPSPGLRAAFAERYGLLIAQQRDPVVTCGLAWGINELLERGTNSSKLARRALNQVLLADASDASKAVVLFLSRLRPQNEWLRLRGSFSPAGTIIVSDFSQLAEAAGEEIREILEDRPHMTGALSQIIESFDQSSALSGILAMASLKLAFRTAVATPLVTDTPERGLRRLFDMVLSKTTMAHGCVFLAIEAIEAIRDKFPKWCAEAMAERVTTAEPALRIGLFVCLAEGYEEFHSGRLQRHVPRFIASHPGVTFQANTTKTADLDRFGQRLSELPDVGILLVDETEWTNKRWSLLERGTP